ncbi:MAG TPA: TetR/AcrR family transcriptional regulator [Solirubrobacterales bacterium]|nr:TetR/AcrR family transcriptional regulator [Solirubrobacterales bacterium]
MTRTPEPVRPWRGISPQQRVVERRGRLLEAALEVFVARGFANSRVRDVCREAGLTERYFYESFADKEALLVALTERIVADLVVAVSPAIELVATEPEPAIDAASRAVVRSLTGDPRRARILLVEVVGVSPAIEAFRRTVIARLAEVIRAGVAGALGSWASTSLEVELVARALVGAAQELLVAYVRGELELDEEALIENLGRLLLRARPVIQALAQDQALTVERTVP